MVLVGALARLGAVQNPMLPIYREREVRFITAQTGAKLLIVPSVWRGFDYEAMARTVAADNPGLEVLVCDKKLPDGDPSTLPAPAAGGAEPFRPGIATDGPWRWIFYTSGTTADPKGARHTDKTVGASAYTMDLVLEMSAEDRNAMVFPFTHIGGIGWLFASLMGGYVHVLVESFVPDTTIPVLRARERHDRGRGYRVPPRVPDRAAGAAGSTDLPGCPRVRRRRCGQAAGAALRGEGRARRASASSAATA